MSFWRAWIWSSNPHNSVIVSNPSFGSLECKLLLWRESYSTALSEMYSSYSKRPSTPSQQWVRWAYTEFRMVSMESNLFEKIVCICRYQPSISRLGTQLYMSKPTYQESNRSNDSIEPLSLVSCFSTKSSQLAFTHFEMYRTDLCPSCITLWTYPS